VTPSGEVIGEEDCLTLDVYAPRNRLRKDYPVVVFVEAETLNGGFGPKPNRYEFAAVAAARNVVVVVPRFRLSALGFLTLGELTKEAGKGSSGNYALSDVLAALDWVQRHVSDFGGDPGSVTVFGHLAGGSIVTALTAAKAELTTEVKADGTLGRKLFHRAWIAR
jgi:carboxylesterase type B